MLTHGASLEEIPPVKEPILDVRIAQLVFNKESLAMIDNKKKVSQLTSKPDVQLAHTFLNVSSELLTDYLIFRGD